VHIFKGEAMDGLPAEVVASIALVALCAFIVMFSRRAKPA
jgi:hypothetical protein